MLYTQKVFTVSVKPLTQIPSRRRSVFFGMPRKEKSRKQVDRSSDNTSPIKNVYLWWHEHRNYHLVSSHLSRCERMDGICAMLYSVGSARRWWNDLILVAWVMDGRLYIHTLILSKFLVPALPYTSIQSLLHHFWTSSSSCQRSKQKTL
jgi:hypothetical protein